MPVFVGRKRSFVGGFLTGVFLYVSGGMAVRSRMRRTEIY